MKKRIKLLSIVISLTLTSIFFSCGESVKNLNPIKTSDHIYLNHSNTLIKKIEGYRKARGVRGIQDKDENWLISVKADRKSIDELKKVYSQKNFDLRNKTTTNKKEIIETNDIIYNDSLNGFWVKYHDAGKRRYRYLLAIDHNDHRSLIQGWVLDLDEFYNKFDQSIKESIQSVIFIDEKEKRKYQDALDSNFDKSKNVYAFKTTEFIFAGETKDTYYYTKDSNYPTSSPDSAWINFMPVYNVRRQVFKDKFLIELLGEDYNVLEEIKSEKGNFPQFEYWIGESSNKKRQAISGFYWMYNVNVFNGSCTDNFDENMETFKEMIHSIKVKN